jgi:hypothetical protein
VGAVGEFFTAVDGTTCRDAGGQAVQSANGTVSSENVFDEWLIRPWPEFSFAPHFSLIFTFALTDP